MGQFTSVLPSITQVMWDTAAFLSYEDQEIPCIEEPKRNLQETIEYLAGYGIKARDFANEVTLPPVFPAHLPQESGGSKELKRARTHDEDDGNTQHERPRKLPRRSHRTTREVRSVGSQTTNPLERVDTQVAGPSTLSPLPRQLAHSDLGRHRSSRHLNSARPLPRTPQRRRNLPPLQPVAGPSGSNTRHSSSRTGRRGDGTWIDTPLVTPNGSLQWALPDNADKQTNPGKEIRHPPDSPLAHRTTPKLRSQPTASALVRTKTIRSLGVPPATRNLGKSTDRLRNKAIDAKPISSRSPPRTRKTRSSSSSPKRALRMKQAVAVQKRPLRSTPPRRSTRIAQRSS